jgi:hypothetical protein
MALLQIRAQQAILAILAQQAILEIRVIQEK